MLENLSQSQNDPQRTNLLAPMALMKTEAKPKLDSIISKMPSPPDSEQDEDSELQDPDLLDETLENDGLLDLPE